MRTFSLKGLLSFVVPTTAAETITRILTILVYAGATAVAAQIKFPIPGNPVPVTLQTAVVLLAGLRLGARDGALSQITYIAGGALGLPFFAGGVTGFAVLAGPTGGYLIGFVFAAYAIGALGKFANHFVSTWLLTFFTSLLLFIPGVIQLKWFANLNWNQAITLGFVPFIVGDLLKVTLSASTHCLFRKNQN